MATKSLVLPLPCGDDTVSDCFRALGGLHSKQFVRFKPRHLEVNIDSIHQRTADLAGVLRADRRRRHAFLFGETLETTWAWVHGSNQNALRGKGNGRCNARDGYDSVFEGLTESFQHLP